MRPGRLSLSLLAAAALVAFAPAAQARTFNLIPAVDGNWLIVDPSAVESVPGGVVRRTWTVGVQRNIVGGDLPQPGYVRTLTDFDCITKQTRWRQFSAFTRSGELLLTRENPSSNWTPASATSETQEAIDVVCRGAVGRSAVSADNVAKVVIALMAAWDPPAAGKPGASPPDKSRSSTSVKSAPNATKVAARPQPAAPAAKAAVRKP